MRVCEIEECGKPHFGKGWCKMHYNRNRRHGDLSANKAKLTSETIHRKITYSAAHYRVRRVWGNPHQYDCISCGLIAEEWAYDHTDPTEFSDEVMRGDKVSMVAFYSRYPEFYAPMCKTCHSVADIARGRN